MTEPFIEVISGVYEGLKVIITKFGSSGLYFGDEFKEGKLIYYLKCSLKYILIYNNSVIHILTALIKRRIRFF